MIGPFSQDAYIPNIPTMETDLNATHFQMNLTLQSNWVLKAVASLAIGYISDRIGRKPTLFGSLLLYILATVACSICTNPWELIAARSVQALGEANAVICQAFVRDSIDDENERLSLMGALQFFKPLALFLGPSVGGTVGTYFGWRWLFRGLSIWGVLTFLGVCLLPETRKPDQDAGSLLANLCTIWSNVWFIGCTLCVSLQFSAILTFLSVFSFILEEFYGKNETFTGIAMGTIPISGMISALTVRTLSQRGFSSANMARAGNIIFIIVGFILYFDHLYFVDKAWYYCVGAILLYVMTHFFTKLPLSNMMVQPFKPIAGLVTGMHGFNQSIMSTGITFLTTDYIFDDHPSSLLWCLIGIIGALQISFWLTIGCRRYDTNKELMKNESTHKISTQILKGESTN